MARIHPPGTPAPNFDGPEHEIAWMRDTLDGLGEGQTRSISRGTMTALFESDARFTGTEWAEMRRLIGLHNMISIDVPGPWIHAIHTHITTLKG